MSDEETRSEKIGNMKFEEGMKLIYEWVKTGVITFKEFYNLIQSNIDKVI